MRDTFAPLMALASIFGCAGCTGMPVTPVRNFERCPFDGGSVKTVTVLAANPWQSSGVIVDVGDELFFEASGQWAPPPSQRWLCSPAGRVGGTRLTPLLREAPSDSLIGRTGASPPFPIGVQAYLKVISPGELYLAMNTPPGHFSDNYGSVEVTIHHRKASGQVQTAPLPSVASGVSLRSASKTRIVTAGISAYNDSGIPKVDYGTGDAKAFAAFAQQAGVPAENITTLVGAEATRSKIIEAVDKLKMATMDKSETAIFYFSGHGAPLVKDGTIYSSVIVPYDASERSLEETGIGLDWIREKLGDLPGSSVVVLDACFTGKEGRSVMAKNLRGLVIVPKGTNIVPPPGTNTWWLTATSGDNFANDLPKESHGLFTYYLLKALSGEQGVDIDQDGLITIKEAFAWTKERVTGISAKSLGRLQVPELIGDGDTVLVIPR